MLVSVSTGTARAAVRVQVWRKLRSLGALYLQPSVCLLPDEATVRREVERLLRRVQLEGGTSHCLTVCLADGAEEEGLVDEFRAAVDLEYQELLDRTPSFLDELAVERAKRRFTYAEVEESEADLERFRRWLAKIERRDYFGGRSRAKARATVDACASALEAFTLAALAAQSEGAVDLEQGRHLSLLPPRASA